MNQYSTPVFLAALKSVLRMSQTHIEDIESGLKDGIYEHEANLDLPEKQFHAALIEQIVTALDQDPSLNLSDLVSNQGNPEQLEHYRGFIRLDNPYQEVEFDVAVGASAAQKDAAMMASIAQVAEISYLSIGAFTTELEETRSQYPEMLEIALDHALLAAKKQSDFGPINEQDKVYLDWLENLIGEFADELDGIEIHETENEPSQIEWIDEYERVNSFYPSTALLRLLVLAKQGGLTGEMANDVETFVLKFGNKLDRILE